MEQEGLDKEIDFIFTRPDTTRCRTCSSVGQGFIQRSVDEIKEGNCELLVEFFVSGSLDLGVENRGFTGPIQTHSSLFSRVFHSLHITEVCGAFQFLAPGIFAVLTLATTVTLIKVLLTVLVLTLSALVTAVVVFITSIVHGVRFGLG